MENIGVMQEVSTTNVRTGVGYAYVRTSTKSDTITNSIRQVIILFGGYYTIVCTSHNSAGGDDLLA
jgi:hypothetical protein